MFAVQVFVLRSGSVTGFQDHVDDRTEWFDQFEEQIHQPVARCRGHDHRCSASTGFVDILVKAKSLTRYDLEIVRGSDCIGQIEDAVRLDPHVHLQLFVA